MMAKIGKYSTEVKGSVGMSGGDIGHGNKGHSAKKNMMKEFHELEPRQKTMKPITGVADDPQTRRPMSRYSKR